jgi:hypothetical protein
MSKTKSENLHRMVTLLSHLDRIGPASQQCITSTSGVAILFSSPKPQVCSLAAFVIYVLLHNLHSSFPRVTLQTFLCHFHLQFSTERLGIRDIGTIDALELSFAHLPDTIAMRALVTVAPFFQEADNAHADLARRSATSIDTTDWRGCGLYDASYCTCHNSLVPQTLMRCLTKCSIEIYAHSRRTSVHTGVLLRGIRPVFRLSPILRGNRSHDLCGHVHTVFEL